MSEEELPEKLDKLEIAPTSALAHENRHDGQLPITFNPFYNSNNEVKPWQAGTANISAPYPIFAHLCSDERRPKSRIRRRSESILDSIKPSSLDSTSGVRKQSLKKIGASSTGTNRKVVLRDPILRALQNYGARRKLHNEYDNEEDTLLNHTTQPSESLNTAARRGITDVRDLLDECRTLLHQNVCVDNVNACQRLNRPIRHAARSSNNRRHRRLSVPDDDNDADEFDIQPPTLPLIAAEPCTCPSSSSCLPEHNTLSTRVNHQTSTQTSCSQQAGNGVPSNCDDVTIDELASYFDTFVYIPKKMSSMAEMMYI